MTDMKKPLIETVDLKKNFGSLQVLKGINQTIYQGEVVSIIGPSGGGKSTFLRCLNLLETPTSGKVIFEGQELDPKSTDLDTHRQKIGRTLLFQLPPRRPCRHRSQHRCAQEPRHSWFDGGRGE